MDYYGLTLPEVIGLNVHPENFQESECSF
ncbi:hypothetical protein LBUL_1945 [Lactobacillus delbrueckii subsp. bulgaricus ATCC BAA-365]|nr:hypothetical protein LBUL_1945 [Lactobacillus delbrueckii subsp. bulgaricus ATCC BAA-365]CDR75943.1 Putative uncharacterized protein [Lactobacillus delbrueckii subsp. bulgaricus]